MGNREYLIPAILIFIGALVHTIVLTNEPSSAKAPAAKETPGSPERLTRQVNMDKRLGWTMEEVIRFEGIGHTENDNDNILTWRYHDDSAVVEYALDKSGLVIAVRNWMKMRQNVDLEMTSELRDKLRSLGYVSMRSDYSDALFIKGKVEFNIQTSAGKG